VGIVDSGINSAHLELAANYRGGADYTGTNLADIYGQGTPVASIIAANRSGTGGLQGIAYNADLTVVKVIDNSGGVTTNNLVAGINYLMATQSAKVMDISAAIQTPTSNLFDIISYNKSVTLFVAAAGDNNSSSPYAPAIYAADLPNSVIAVVAVDNNNALAMNSNSCGVAGNYCLAAPGYNIYAAKSDGGYVDKNGTVIAAAYVTGAAAVLRAAWPVLTPQQTAQILLTTATHIFKTLGENNTTPNDVYGYGLLNLENAVQAQGQNTVMFTSKFISGAGYDANSSSINSSAVFGDAYSSNVAPILQKAVFFDDYGRDYKANLDTKIKTSTSTYSLENLMFNNYSVAAMPGVLGNNFKFRLLANNLTTDPFSGEVKSSKLGLKYLTYDKSKEDYQAINSSSVSFSYAGNINPDLKVGFSNNDLNNSFNNNLVSDFAFIASANNFSPYQSLSRQDFSSGSTGILNQKLFFVVIVQ
jgi:hypothetical protein